LLDLQGLLLRLLVRPGVVTFVLPLVIVVLTLGLRLVATPRNWKPEDFAVGLDLMMVALGSDLAALSGWRMLDRHDFYIRAHLELANVAVPVLLWTSVGIAVWIRYRAWEEGDEGDRELSLLKGVLLPVLWALAAVAAVYWIIARLLGAP
jgi:hypothetical protein